MTHTAFELRNLLHRANISALVSAEAWCSKDCCDLIVHVFITNVSFGACDYCTSRRGHGSKKKVTCIILVTGPFLGKPVGGHLTTIGCFIAQSYLDIFAKQILETEIAFARSHLKLNQTDVALGRKQVQITCLSRFEPL